MYVFDAALVFVVACRRCGVFGTRKFLGLTKKCRGQRTVAGDKVWQQLRRGVHPYFGKIKVGPPIRVRAADLRDSASHGCPQDGPLLCEVG